MVVEPDVSLVAWTTTPWTLVSNLALCVHPNMTYVRVKGKVSWERGCEVLFSRLTFGPSARTIKQIITTPY